MDDVRTGTISCDPGSAMAEKTTARRNNPMTETLHNFENIIPP
jgi:hypothetical protein